MKIVQETKAWPQTYRQPLPQQKLNRAKNSLVYRLNWLVPSFASQAEIQASFWKKNQERPQYTNDANKK